MPRNVIDDRPKNVSISNTHKGVFQCLDNQIKENLNSWTCNDVRSVYFDWWHEQKWWRTTSSNFGGYSEFLIFRLLYHVLEEMGEKFQPKRLGVSGSDPVIFRSEKYEIGNGNSLRINGKLLKPDIYVKDIITDKILVIIEIKITTGSLTGINERGERKGGKWGINAMVKRLGQYRPICDSLLLIVFNWQSYKKHKAEIDREWFSNIVLEDESRLLKEVLLELMAQ